MDYYLSLQHNDMHVAIIGKLTFIDHTKFSRIIDEVKTKPIESIHLDFSHTDFIDSAGLGMLLLLRDICMEKRIQAAIASAHGQVERIFMISKFEQLFTIKN